VRDAIELYLSNQAGDIKTFWLTGKELDWDVKTLQDHADYIYIRTLLGDTNWYCTSAVEKYADFISSLPLAGRADCSDRLLPHLTAYLLASLNLLALQGADYRAKVLGSIKLDLNVLIDQQTFLPKWPAKWSHHTWRVSHWIGGIPSILLNFARHDPNKQVDEQLVYKVLEACDKNILQPKSGLMKAYNSEFLQQLFRLLYRLRHNPEHGDIGGLVHIHWINHVMGRPYVASDQLVTTCMKHMRAKPFFEKVPYCLDFDYVQLVRTALEQKPSSNNDVIKKRILEFRQDLTSFFTAIPYDGYSLHKLPGALATLHEACLLLKSDIPDLKIQPIDIIKQAYWL
jgi:hypothetical protein